MGYAAVVARCVQGTTSPETTMLRFSTEHGSQILRSHVTIPQKSENPMTDPWKNGNIHLHLYLNLPWKISHSCRYCKYTIFPWMILDQKSPEGQMFYWPFGEKLLAGVFFFVPLIWVFPKIVGFPRKSSNLIGFSIIFTIHFGVALFLEHPFTDNEFSYWSRSKYRWYLPAVGYSFGNACRYIHETLCDLHEMAKAFQGAYLDTSQGIFCQTKLTGSLDVLIYTHRMLIVQSFCHKSPYTTAAIAYFFWRPMPTKCMTFHLHSF